MIAGTLEIQMLANMARLAKDMSEAKSTVERSMKGIESAVASAKTALAALGIGVSVGFFAGLINSSIDAMDRLDDLKQVTNLTVEELSGLKLLAAQSGTSMDNLSQAIGRMSVAMGKEPERFKALGVEAKNNKEAFMQMADIFAKLPDIQQRNALAQAVFNKSWQEVAPTLSMGGAAIGEIIDKGARLAGVTSEMADTAHKYKAEMAELDTVLGAARTRVVGGMLPSMGELARAMNEAAKEGGALLTIWVGLGGALAFLLGQTEAQQTKKRLEEINEQMAIANKQLAAGSLKPKGAVDSFWSFLIPDVVLSGEAIRKIKGTVAALEAEKAKLMPKTATPGGPTPDAAAEAAARAKAFLDEANAYAARVATIRGATAQITDAIRSQNRMAEFAFKEGGINNQRTQEELIRQQSALREKDLRSQLAGAKKLQALAIAKENQKDAAAAAADIIKIQNAIADNGRETEAKIRADRTVTAQQQLDQYNAAIAAREQQGASLAESLRDATVRENDEYQNRLINLETYLAGAQGQIADDAVVREALEVQHQQNLLEIERNKHQAERGMQIGTWQLGAELLQALAGKSKLAAIAVIAINKGLAIAQVIQATAVATMRAFSDLGPAAGIPAAATIRTLGAVQIGLIAATGLLQAGNVGGGGASLGSPSNPVSTTGGGAASFAQQQQQPPQIVLNLTVNGHILDTQEFTDTILVPALQDAIDNRDVTIIGANSRQAANLVSG